MESIHSHLLHSIHNILGTLREDGEQRSFPISSAFPPFPRAGKKTHYSSPGVWMMSVEGKEAAAFFPSWLPQ